MRDHAADLAAAIDDLDNGLLMVGSGQHSMRFRPPLNISQEEIDQGIEIIERSLRQVLA